MAKKRKSRNDEFESFQEGIFDSFGDIFPKAKSSRTFDLSDKFKNTSQRLAFTVYEQHDIIFLLGPAGTGKALTLDSKLYARNGPIRMGDVKIGDEVADHTGNFSKVTGVYPQGKKQICRVWFSDETHVDCCEEHLWEVKHRGNGWTRVVDTKFLESNCRRPIDDSRQLSVICPAPINFDRRSYFVPPYLMGLILAEGNTTNSNLSFSTCESEIAERVKSELRVGYVCKKKDKRSGSDYRIVKDNRNSKPNLYKEALKEMGVWGKYSWEKFIPEEYMYGSVDQRVALLQGLMDGDGTVEKTGSMSYSTTSFKLAEDFCDLVRSLGGTTKIRPKEGSLKSDGSRHRVSYRCYINLPNDVEVFFLGRKKRLHKARTKYLPKKYIDRVERLGEAEMQCITVDNPRHLYLTDNFTVTHNSHLACMFAIYDLLNDNKSRIVLTRPIVEAGENLGYLPGTFSEKTDPYMMPLYDCIQKLVPGEGGWAKVIQENSEVAPLAYMRGRAEPLDNLIPTPSGHRRMGDLNVGDQVFGSDGSVISITGVYPQGKKRICRITFTDGSSVLCSEDHLWNTQTRSEKRHRRGFSTKTTIDIASNLKAGHANNHEIPIVSSVVQIPAQNVELDPYLLGVLLGDGCFTTDASITVTNIDKDVLQEISSAIPNGVKLRKTNGLEHRLSGERNRPNPIRRCLKKLGLWGKKSWEKFVPECYLWNSEDVRLSLLQGLLDTDGSAFFHRSGKTRIQFYSTSDNLAEQVVWLVQSLGGVAHMWTREYSVDDSHELRGRVVSHKRNSFVVDIVLPRHIKPFRCERKLARCGNPPRIKRMIESIDFVSEMECQCISVDSKDRLYLTENFLVTHNTFDNSVCILDEAQNCTWGQLLLFLTRLGENSKMIVTGDPCQSDIGRDSALMDVVHRLEGVEGIGTVRFNEEHIVRHKLVSEIIKRLQKHS